MSKLIDGFSREKYIELVAQITTGLLASGHFTNYNEEYGDAWALYSKEEKHYFAVAQAEEILESIIGRHDALSKMIDEES